MLLGMVGGHVSGVATTVSSCVAIIAGTSTCVLAVSQFVHVESEF